MANPSSRAPAVAGGARKGTTMRRSHDSGMALVSTLMVMMVMSAMLIGFFAVIAADQQASGVNRDQTQAYAAAQPGWRNSPRTSAHCSSAATSARRALRSTS